MWQPYQGEGVAALSVGVIATQQNCYDWADTLGLTYPVLSDFDQTVWNEYGQGYGRPLNLVIDQHMVIMWKEETYEPGLTEILAQIEEALPHPPLSGPEDPADGEPAWFPSPPILNWADSPSVGTQHDVTNYLVQLASDEGMSQVILEQATPDATSELPVSSDLFSPSTQYFWRVQASDDGGQTWGTWSSVWDFTTHEGFEIELGAFSAAWLGGNRVLVGWTTYSESSVYGFHLLRADAPAGPYHRVTDAAMPARGSEGSGATYSRADHVPGPGRYFYLLEEIELGGTSNRYGPVEALVGSFGLGMSVDVDPAGDALVLGLELPQDCQPFAELWDVSGRVVASRALGTLCPGVHRVRWKLEEPLPTGRYLVRVKALALEATMGLVISR